MPVILRMGKCVRTRSRAFCAWEKHVPGHFMHGKKGLEQLPVILRMGKNEFFSSEKKKEKTTPSVWRCRSNN